MARWACGALANLNRVAAGPGGLQLLRQLNLKAIEADPNSQFGYIGLAWSYRFDAVFGWHEQEHDRDEALKLAAEYADKAILIAPDDSGAHEIRARIHTCAWCATHTDSTSPGR